MDISEREMKPSEKLLAFKKRKPPQVRQTLTSKYRLLKANPLLMYELGKNVTSDSDNKEEAIFKPLKTLVSALDASMGVQSQSVATKTDKNKVPDTSIAKHKTAPKPETKKPLPNNKPTLEARKKLLNQYTIVRKNNKATVELQKSVSKNANKSLFVTKQDNKHLVLDSGNFNIPAAPNRRSTITVKMPTINHSIVKLDACIEQPEPEDNDLKFSVGPKQRTQILETFRENNVSAPVSVKPSNNKLLVSTLKKKGNEQLNISNTSQTPIQTTDARVERTTLTPINAARRITIFATPNDNRRKSMSISTSASKDMTRRLGEWLQSRGKNARAYHHLKCFGVQQENITQTESIAEEKENIIEINTKKEDLFEEIKPLTEEPDYKTITEEALIDLHKLILDGYPPDQCETWLKLIKQKYTPVVEKPHYWECRAALEQTKGNINLAVECYKNAIIQGAEVQSVDECLDQLLQKFSLLDINGEADACNNERSKIVKDARNIFKSSIIQFAVQERTFKKKCNDGIIVEKKFIATPVRRSTRLSRSAFTSTPSVQIYSSLKEIDSSLRDNLNFQCNRALKD